MFNKGYSKESCNKYNSWLLEKANEHLVSAAVYFEWGIYQEAVKEAEISKAIIDTIRNSNNHDTIPQNYLDISGQIYSLADNILNSKRNMILHKCGKSCKAGCNCCAKAADSAPMALFS